MFIIHFQVLFQEARQALRNLSRHPLHAAAVAFLLALGLGSTLAVFALVDRLLLHPAPYPDAGQVVAVYGVNPKFAACQFNPSSFAQLRQGTTLFQALAAFDGKPLVLGQGTEAEGVAGGRVTAGYFEVLGARPLLGRLHFTADEDRWGGPGVVVVTEAAWRRRHGADPGLVGSSVVLDGLPRTVVGILPQGINPPTSRLAGAEYYLPAAFSPVEQAEQGNGWDVAGRLRGGLGLAQAGAALDAFASTRTVPGRTGFRAAAIAGELGRRWREPLGLFGGAALLVLVLAGINSAALVLARTEARRGDLAVHSALGASSSRLAGLLVLEGAVMATAGFLLGLPIAWLLRAALVRHFRLDGTPPFSAATIFGSLLGTLIILLLSSALPALAAARTHPAEVLKARNQGVAKGGRHGVLVAELALASTLLVGSAMLLRSLINLTRLPTGMERPEQVLAGTVTFPAGAFTTAQARANAFRTLLANLRTLPGVTHAALTQTAPLYKFPGSGLWETSDGRAVEVYRHWGAGDVPGALGLGLQSGRMPEPGEEACAVSANLAARLWPGGVAVGRAVPWSQGRRLTVVGVLTATVEQDPRQGLCCQVWIPLDRDLSFVDVFLRCSGPPLSMTSALRKAIATAAPGAQLLRSGTLSGAIEATREAPRKAAWLLGFLALLALLLAGAGVYGVAAQLVLSRRQEFAIRLALGETPGGLARLVFGQTSRLALLGLSLGLLGSVWVGMVAKHLLLGVGNLDPLSWAGGGLLLLAAALLATLMPALRAARTQPAAALRSEEGRRHAGRSPGVARASPRWIKIGGRACPNDSRSRQ